MTYNSTANGNPGAHRIYKEQIASIATFPDMWPRRLIN